MKFATVLKSLVLGLTLLLVSSAFAGGKDTKASVEFGNPVLVNGTTLKPGDYKVQWEGTGSNVQVSFLQGKTVVAKASAHVVELKAPSANDAAITQKNDSGPNSLSGLRFQGKTFSLELDQAAAKMQAPAESASSQ